MSKSFEAFQVIAESFKTLDSIETDAINPQKTLVIITDMVNGFAHFGALSSPRVADIAEPIAQFAGALAEKGVDLPEMQRKKPVKSVDNIENMVEIVQRLKQYHSNT